MSEEGYDTHTHTPPAVSRESTKAPEVLEQEKGRQEARTTGGIVRGLIRD